MKCASHQFLAGSTLACDQCRRRAVGDLANEVVDPEHLGSLADDAVLSMVRRRPEAPPVCLFGPEGLGDDPPKLLLVKGLGDVVVGAPLDGFDCRVDGSVGRDEDDGQTRAGVDAPPEELHATHLGHLEVGHHEVEVDLVDSLLGNPSVFGGLDLVAGAPEVGLEHLANAGLVVDDEDPLLHGVPGSMGRGARRRL